MSEELKQINDSIKEIGSAWEASKKTQDELDAKIAKNEGGQAELKSKLDKIDADLNSALDMKKSLEETAAAVKRMSATVENHAEENGAEVKAFSTGIQKWLAKGMPQSVEGLGLDEKEAKALQSNIDPQGGYTIQPYIGMIEKIIFDTSPVRSLASVITIGSNEYVGYYDDNEFDAGWIGEIASRADTATADIGEFRIPVREMYSRFKISERLLEDSSWNMESWASSDVADKFARLEATAFVTGSGPVQPEGLTTATAKTSNGDVYTRGQIGAKATAGATAITTDELVDVRALLKASYRGNAYYFYNRATESYVRKLKDGQGNYIWQPVYTAGEPDMLLGQKTVVFEDMPDIATGAIAVGLGDLRSTYQIVDRTGMSILRDPYSSASTGQVVFHMRKRVGGGIKNWDAMKYLKQA
jgi:HK97 family phage major capsid protein